MKRYIVIGGKIISKNDGQEHYINAKELCTLYKVNPEECILMEENETTMMGRRPGRNSLILLRPRYDGNYSLPPQYEITIKFTPGSLWQDEIQIRQLKTFFKAWKIQASNQHKENKITIKLNGEEI